MTKVCKRHQAKPAFIYGTCVGCEIESYQSKLEQAERYKSALRKIVCLNVTMPDEVFNIANDALERRENP